MDPYNIKIHALPNSEQSPIIHTIRTICPTYEPLNKTRNHPHISFFLPSRSSLISSPISLAVASSHPFRDGLCCVFVFLPVYRVNTLFYLLRCLYCVPLSNQRDHARGGYTTAERNTGLSSMRWKKVGVGYQSLDANNNLTAKWVEYHVSLLLVTLILSIGKQLG